MITVAIVAGAFIAGVLVGVIALLRAGIAREESGRSLRDEPPNRASAVTRRMVGLYVRMPSDTRADDEADFADTRNVRALPARPRR
jgi:hypothetical protein